MTDAQDVNEGSFVLVQAYRLQQAFQAAPEPPASAWWLVMERAEQKARGSLYRPSAWFGGDFPERIRKRCRRAIDRLEAEGLVVAWRKYGGRLTHVKLTPEGERLAIELLATHDKQQPPAGDVTANTPL